MRVTVEGLEMAGADNGGVVGRDEERGMSWLGAGGMVLDMTLIGLGDGRRKERSVE